VKLASMLPGFRFLFAAIVLSMSIMVFGLGAASLFRAAHEEFASNPSWRATPETSFAQQSEATKPVLAMLRVDPPPAEPKTANDVPPAAVIAAPVEPVGPAAQPPMPAGPEKTAALTSEDSVPADTAKSETPAKPDIQAVESKVTENKATEDKPVQIKPVDDKGVEDKGLEVKGVEVKGLETKAADASPSAEAAPAPADAPAPVADAKIVTAEQAAPPANDVAPAVSEPASIAVAPDAPVISTKIATLGGPAVTIEAAPSATAKAASTKKRVQARRAARRRRLARRARVVAQTIQASNPFAPTPVAVDQRR
jgi:hypothetical protein